MRKDHDRETRATSPRTAAGLLLALCLAAVAAVLPTAAAATPSPTKLAEQGWDCALTPPFVVPTRIACGTPGTGRPFPGNPDPRPTYRLWLFSLAGELVGTVHFVRADLYAGQPCNGGDAYEYFPNIGYYECINLDS